MLVEISVYANQNFTKAIDLMIAIHLFLLLCGILTRHMWVKGYLQ